MELWLISGLVAVAAFAAAAIMTAAKPKPEPGKPKFVVASAGLLGCLMTISVIIGLLSSVISLVASAKKLFE